MGRLPSLFPVVIGGLLLFACSAVVSGPAGSKETSYVHMNKIIDKLERNLLVCGLWVNCLHPSTAVGLARLNGFPSYEDSLTRPMIDFVLIDMEHEPFDTVELRNFLLALHSRREVLAKGNLQPNVATLVRIPQDADRPVAWMIKQVLDVGAHGVIVPHVRNARDAEKIVKACRYPQPKDSPVAEPAGIRGAAPRLCSYLWGLSYSEYIERADVWPLNPKGDLLVVVMIEDEDGVRNLDEILDVKGIGAVMFGPFDYSFMVGHGGNQRHAKVTKTWSQVKEVCDRHKVPLIGFAGPRNIAQRLREGYKMLMIGEDYDLTGKAAGVLEYLRKYGSTPAEASAPDDQQ